jgi:CO/xanthine dehydrogenase FAD-binding subunit
MKPAQFDYAAPESLQEAMSLLSQHGDTAKVLAGGQSLGPLLNMRLAYPELLIDLNKLDELAYLNEQDGHLKIGALTRQRAVELSPAVKQGWALLHEVMPYIAHTTIRNRGTVCGSIAHADPAAELPAVAAALDAEMIIAGPDGTRSAKPEEFFFTYLTTTLSPEELLTEVRFPPLRPRTGQAWLEFARRHGDYALVGVAAMLTLDENDKCTDARLVYSGIDSVPFSAQEASGLLVGEQPTEELFTAAVERAAAESSPGSDLHASSEYRRHLIRVLTRRALRLALDRVGDEYSGA